MYIKKSSGKRHKEDEPGGRMSGLKGIGLAIVLFENQFCADYTTLQ